MKYALFLGCKIPSQVPAYETSTRAVMERLGVQLVDLKFACCGYPARAFDRAAFVVSAARNLALAERAGLDILTPCACCLGTLRHAIRLMEEDDRLREQVEAFLADDGLAWSGKSAVEHVLAVLVQRVGVDKIRAALIDSMDGMRVAAQYGCHLLRPSDVARFDNPLAPTSFENLIEAAGAVPVDWSRSLDCCGDAVHEADPDLAAVMTIAKARSAIDDGAEVLCTACPHCHLRFSAATGANETRLPVLLVTQLVGLALGLTEVELGIREGAVARLRNWARENQRRRAATS